MRMVLPLFLLIVLQSTITFNFTAAGNETDSDFERTISDHTTFTFSSSSPRTSVEVSGEWDGWKRHNMTLINDVYSINLKLNEGFYCYKLILDVDEWILDPSNSYKKYCDGILNSGFVVENLSKPKIAINYVSDSLLNITVNYSASIPGYEVSDFEAYLMKDFVKQNVSYTWDDDDWTFNIDVNFSDMNFDFGKYTLYLQAFDSNGSESNQITYPFWYESEKFDWNGALIYMIVTDRFVNGNISNDPSPLSEASSGADWEGGDFAGVISMLESGYFQQLGVSALWLTPFNTGADGTYLASDNTHQVSAYHGYWPIKAREIDSRLGTEAELKQLIALAHSQGIRIMNDFVINHVHENHEYYLSNPEWFRNGCVLGTDGCDWTERALDGVFSSYMPDVNWQNSEVSETFVQDAIWWQKEFDLDGSRIDAVKHVEPSAIANLVTKFESELENNFTDYYLLGETAMGWNGDNLEDNIAEYESINQYLGDDGLDGQGDFVLYHAVVDNVFRFGYKDYQHLDYWTHQSQLNYMEGSIMTPYLGSHDTSRLVSRLDSGGNNPDNKWIEQSLPQQPSTNLPYIKSKLAFSWLLTIPGAPVLYMGDEYGEFGGSDPDNRHSFRLKDSLNSNELNLLSFVEEMGILRKNSQDLLQGVYRPIFSDDSLLFFSRESLNSETLVFINSGEQPREISLSYSSDIFYEYYLDVKHNLSLSVKDGIINFTVNSQDVAVFASHNFDSTPFENNETDDSGETTNSNETTANNETIAEEAITDIDDSNVNNDTLVPSDENSDESEIEDNSYSGVELSNNEGDLIILRSILLITFLSLIVAFVYTRNS